MGPTHHADADRDSREYIPTADSLFYRFSTPPFRLSFHLCFRVVLVVCVFVPCGILRGSCPSEWSQALRVVLRGFVVLPAHGGRGGAADHALRGTVRCRPGLCGAPCHLGPRLNPEAAAARGPSCRHHRLSLAPTLCSARLCGPLWVRALAYPRALPRPDGELCQRPDLHSDVHLRLRW